MKNGNKISDISVIQHITMDNINNNPNDIAKIIIEDIMNDAPISNILLKTKIFASKVNDSELSNWIEAELFGYDDNLPSYRKLLAGIKINVQQIYGMFMNIVFPVDAINNNEIRSCLESFDVYAPIAEIEQMLNTVSPTLQKEVPVALWNTLNQYVNGDIQAAYQYTNSAGLANIATSVKNLILNHMLEYSKNNKIDFPTLMKTKDKNTITHQTNYNASIVNNGDGNLTANNVATALGNNNSCLKMNSKSELLDILDKIKSKAPKDNSDLNEVFSEIDTELNKDEPSTKILKRAFQALGGLLTGVVSGITANEITPLIHTALSLF